MGSDIRDERPLWLLPAHWGVQALAIVEKWPSPPAATAAGRAARWTSRAVPSPSRPKQEDKYARYSGRISWSTGVHGTRDGGLALPVDSVELRISPMWWKQPPLLHRDTVDGRKPVKAWGSRLADSLASFAGMNYAWQCKAGNGLIGLNGSASPKGTAEPGAEGSSLLGLAHTI